VSVLRLGRELAASGGQTGRTILEWISERRMAQARRLLVETDLAAEEIGHRVGYRDPGYFARSFRRSHGTTPDAPAGSEAQKSRENGIYGVISPRYERLYGFA
jgi:AraC-like DNA-binding protein